LAALRTLIVTLSPMLRDLVLRVLAPDIAIDIIEIRDTRDALAERVRDLAPDLVVIGLLASENHDLAQPLLQVAPPLRILLFSPQGQTAWLHGPGTTRVALADLSVQALKSALQDIAPPNAD
jgi:chemotaxis response regulator CheB